mmetsp:Transcript_73364/g.174781  ORF Transcript_73364/g.174781 Transcript_73364/m.174781 type:complete len:584 (+) Transcript_73364:128-1879(+)
MGLSAASHETSLDDEILAESYGSSTVVPATSLPLRTEGRHIVGEDGERVRLFCVNWYGAHMRQMVNGGLHLLTLEQIAERIIRLRFNCVRMPYSLDLIFGNATSVEHETLSLAANPNLQGMSPLEVYDACVKAVTDAGLLVILNNHVSTKMWCCSPWDGEGLWRTAAYSQERWLESMTFVGQRFANNPRVVGIDLRNEPRRSRLGYPTWGLLEGMEEDDWSGAAALAGKIAHAANPNLLVVVSGINFPMHLCELGHRPLHVSEPDLQGRVVYTIHEYSWWSFDCMTHKVLGHLIPYLVILAIIAVATLCKTSPTAERSVRCGALICTFSLAVLATVLLLISMTYSKLIQTTACGPDNYWASLIYLFVPYGLAHFTGVCWTFALIAYFWRIYCSNILTNHHTSRGDGRPMIEAVDSPQEDLSEEGYALGGSRDLATHEDAARSHSSWRSSAGKFIYKHQAAVVVAVCSLTIISIFEAFREETGRYDVFEAEMNRRWGFALEGTDDIPPAPIWIGEFGTSVDDIWWQNWKRYVVEQDLDWCYWAFNGEKWRGVPESYGLFRADWQHLRQPWKLHQLHEMIDAVTR